MASSPGPAFSATTVQLKGTDKLLRTFRALEDAVRGEHLMLAAQVGATIVVGEAKTIVPVDTGNLRASITTEEGPVSKTRALIYVGYGSQAPYGRFVELGTDRMAAQPFLRPALTTKGAAAGRAMGTALWQMITAAGRS